MLAQVFARRIPKLRLLKWLVFGPLCVAIILIAYLLRPFLLLRFGNFRNYTFGSYFLHAETYLCDRELGILQPKGIDFFSHSTPSSNTRLDQLINRQFNVTGLAKFVSALLRKMPGGEQHLCTPGSGKQDLERNFLAAFSTKQHLKLTSGEIREAETLLKDMFGWTETPQFVCFASRDHKYLSALRPDYSAEKSEFRNSKIQDKVPAAEMLAERYGMFSIRMGANVEAPIVTSHPKVIDYGYNRRNELLDLYLPFNCSFMISDHSGLFIPSLVGRRPLACTNLIPLEGIIPWNGLFIPKMIWLERSRRFLTLREMIQSRAALWDNLYNRTCGIDEPYQIVDNTADEICDLALEMAQRLKKEWFDTPQDLRLQEAFQESINHLKLYFGGPMIATIATSFLRRHPYFVLQMPLHNATEN